MMPSEYDIGDLMGLTDDEHRRGYKVELGLSVSMSGSDDDGNLIWVTAGRGSVTPRRKIGEDTCWWVSLCEKDPAGGWGEELIRITDDVDEPKQLHDLLEDMGVNHWQIHETIKLWLWG